jgi:hypothetical protein
MTVLGASDIVWNRACEGGGEEPRSGDAALASLLLFHGAAMNGGFLHAVDCLTPAERERAKAGYVYFGLDPVAELISNGEAVPADAVKTGEVEAALDAQYWAVVPSDSVLVQRFQEHYSERPNEYSPVHQQH